MRKRKEERKKGTPYGLLATRASASYCIAVDYNASRVQTLTCEISKLCSHVPRDCCSGLPTHTVEFVPSFLLADKCYYFSSLSLF